MQVTDKSDALQMARQEEDCSGMKLICFSSNYIVTREPLFYMEGL